MLSLAPAVVAAALIGPGSTPAVSTDSSASERPGGCQTRACERRVVKKRRVHRVYPFCNTWACVTRVTRKHEWREMRSYKRNPLPWCTWGPESGAGRPEWSMARYQQPNVSGGDGGGKFQILESTWSNHGGDALDSSPVGAKPVYQERIARRVYTTEGPNAWTNC